jgi:hypothetical protein
MLAKQSNAPAQSTVRYEGPPPPEGRTVNGLYFAPSPLETLSHVLPQKQFKEELRRVFDTCMQAKGAGPAR